MTAPSMSTERSDLATDPATAWLAGGGEMGERIRPLDWSATPLGPAGAWPQSLRSAVSILLPSKAQICLFWGPELIKLYNDAYIPVLGRKHPGLLGRPAREVWSEIWDVLGPAAGRRDRAPARRSGPTTTSSTSSATGSPRRRTSTSPTIPCATSRARSAASSASSARRPAAC